MPGNIRHDLFTAAGDYNAVRVELLQRVDRGCAVEPHIYPVFTELCLHGVDEFGDHPLAWGLGGENGASAKLRVLFKYDRSIPALFQEERRFHAAGAAADNGDCSAAARADELIIAIYSCTAGDRIHRTMECTVGNDGLAAIETAEAFAYKLLAACHGLIAELWVCNVPAGDADEIAYALLKQRLCGLRVLDGVHGDNRDGNICFDGLCKVLAPALRIIARLDHRGRACVNAAAYVQVIRAVRVKVLGNENRLLEIDAVLHKIAAVYPQSDHAAAAADIVDALKYLDGEPAAVFKRAAVLVGTLVRIRADELLEKIPVRGVKLDAVCAGAERVCRCSDKLFLHIGDIVKRHFARHDDLSPGDAVKLHARRHGLPPTVDCRRRFAAAVLELYEHFCPVAVHGVDHLLKRPHIVALTYA